MKISFESVPNPVRNRWASEQAIDVIDKAQGRPRKPSKIAIKLSKCQEFLRFLVTVVNSFISGCYSIFHSGILGNRRNILRFRARGGKSQEITSWRNLLIHRYLKYLFNNTLHLGTVSAALVHNMEFPMKVNRISTKRLAILSAAFWPCCARNSSLLKKPINRKHH